MRLTDSLSSPLSGRVAVSRRAAINLPIGGALILAGLLVPVAASAQVSYTGTAATQNFGSEAIGSTSAVKTFSFSISAGTTVGSIGVMTVGSPNLDFASATGSTCAAAEYVSAATCTVNVTFKPRVAGVRRGAVVFFSAANNTGTILGKVPVYGIGTGPQIAYSPPTATIIDPTVNGKALNQFAFVTLDAAGDLFIADTQNNRVVEVPAGGGTAIAIGPTVGSFSLLHPWGVAVDGAGDLFISDFGNERIVEVPAGGGAATAFSPMVNGSPVTSPTDLAFDGAGDLFIADTQNNRVVEVPAGGGAATAIAPVVDGVALSAPYAVAVDGVGDLFISDQNSNPVVEVPSGGGAAIAIAPTVDGKGLNFATGVALDAAGDLFIADFENSRVVEVPVGEGAATAVDIPANASVESPVGLAFDATGDLFISDYNKLRLVELLRTQPPALNFPTATGVGITDTTDGPQTVQITNIGNEALMLTDLSYPADFSAASGDDNACTGSTSLSAGQECDLAVEFTPEHVGALSEVLTLTDNALNVAGAHQSIGLSGTGEADTTVSLSATHLAWGSVNLGTATGSTSVTMTNTGAVSLGITSITVTGADASSFVFANTCGTSVAAGANCSIHGHFAPQADGPLTAAVSIVMQNSSPLSIALSGTGTGTASGVSLSATSLSFGSVNLGESSASQSVTLTNTGGPLTISGITLTGSGASSFVFASACPSTLAPNASCTIHGHFAPQADGAFTATVVIADSAGNSPQSITLSGTGTGALTPTVTLSATSVAFGDEPIGVESDAQTVTLTNTGTETLAISSIAMTGTNASSFLTSNTCATSIAVGANCSLRLRFYPGATGPATAALTITDNASNSPQSIALSGTGVKDP